MKKLLLTVLMLAGCLGAYAANPTLSGNQTFTGANTFNNAGNSFTGNAGPLTNLTATNINWATNIVQGKVYTNGTGPFNGFVVCGVTLVSNQTYAVVTSLAVNDAGISDTNLNIVVSQGTNYYTSTNGASGTYFLLTGGSAGDPVVTAIYPATNIYIAPVYLTAIGVATIGTTNWFDGDVRIERDIYLTDNSTSGFGQIWFGAPGSGMVIRYQGAHPPAGEGDLVCQGNFSVAIGQNGQGNAVWQNGSSGATHEVFINQYDDTTGGQINPGSPLGYSKLWVFAAHYFDGASTVQYVNEPGYRGEVYATNGDFGITFYAVSPTQQGGSGTNKPLTGGIVAARMHTNKWEFTKPIFGDGQGLTNLPTGVVATNFNLGQRYTNTSGFTETVIVNGTVASLSTLTTYEMDLRSVGVMTNIWALTTGATVTDQTIYFELTTCVTNGGWYTLTNLSGGPTVVSGLYKWP